MSHPETAAPPERLNFARHLLALNAGRPDKTALIDDAGSLTYGQLADLGSVQPLFLASLTGEDKAPRARFTEAYTQALQSGPRKAVTGTLTLQSSGDFTAKSDKNLTTQAGMALTDKAGTSLTNQAGTSLDNKAGTTLTNDAGVSLTNKAAAEQTVDGGGMLTIKGGLVKVN